MGENPREHAVQVWECCYQSFLWIWTGHSKVSNLTWGARASSTGLACDNHQLKNLKLAMTTRIENSHMHFEEVFAWEFGPP